MKDFNKHMSEVMGNSEGHDTVKTPDISWTSKQKKHAYAVVGDKRIPIKHYIKNIALKLPVLKDGKGVVNHFDAMWKGYMRCETKNECFGFLAGYQKAVIDICFPPVPKYEEEHEK